MYSLLKQKPHALSDEKTVLFSLIDNFINSIETYRKEYNTIKDNKTLDLQKKENDGKSALNRLRDSQEEEKRNHAKKMNSLISGFNTEIENSKKRTLADLESVEDDVERFDRDEKQKLEKYNHDQQRYIDAQRRLKKSVKDTLNEVDVIVGTTVLGHSKVEKILSKQEIDNSISNVNEARDWFSQNVMDEVKEWRDEIKTITESLPKKVIYHGKRNTLIGQIALVDAKMETGLKILEKDMIDEYWKMKRRSQESCKKYRTVSNSKKEELIRQRDKFIALKNDQISNARTKFQEESNQMRSAHSMKYDQQSKYYATQLASTRSKWDEQLLQCSASFMKKMEEEFPSNRFNAWIKQFWMHPKNVEDYDNLRNIQMNMLIGVAEVSIFDWYNGGAAEAIKKVLSRYSLLFGINNENARKAYMEGKWYLPYTISIENGDSVLLSYDNQCDDRVKAIVNAIGMRLLRSVPACMMRFQLFDADGIGAFGRLMALDPATRNNPLEPTVKSIAIGDGGKVHSTDIPKQIEETKILMDDLSTQLTNYSSIREFNDQNPLSKQIYRPILMMNFPSGLDEKEIKMLNAMMSNCRKWGFSMVLAQPDKEKNAIKPELQRYVTELYKSVLYLRADASVKYLKVVNPRFLTEKNANIYVYGLPNINVMDAIAADIREKSVAASSIKINFADAKGICPTSSQMYSQKADAGIEVPIGYLEGGQPFKMQFDDKHVHSIVMGNTGSGKTNLLHVMMTNIMLRYDPTEVMLYLIDFKYGLDFRVYTQYNLPNFKSISITNDPEFALAILEHLEKEQTKRSLQMGSKYQKISDYNADHPNQKLNRVILIVDELYELVKKAPTEIQTEIVKKIDSFAHQWRAFGLHLVISGQDLNKIDRFDTIKNQCTTRLALHCEDEQVKTLMVDEGVARMHSIDASDQGACVFSLSAGKDPQIEHTALLTSKQHGNMLQEIHNHYLSQKRITNVRILLTNVSDNPNHILQMFVDKGFLPESDYNKMYVGDPISLERELNFQPQGNVWIAGGNVNEISNKAANSLMMFIALSLAMQKLKSNTLDICCTNFSDHPMRSVEDEQEDRLGQLTSNFPSIFNYNTGNEFLTSLDYMLNELDDRQNGINSSSKAIWWIVARPELLKNSNNAGNTVIGLSELLKNGPKYNIHVVLWTNDVKKANALQLNRVFFKERVCLEMSTEESKWVNGDELKPMPTGYKAVLIGRNLNRFRIYDLPNGRWMNQLFTRLNTMNK